MPAPKFLSSLPKPALFGLYGGCGGFAGALFIAEPIYASLLWDIHHGRVPKNLAGLLMISAALWTAAITAPICAALSTGQHHYLKGSWPEGGRVALGVGGGILAGLFGGCAGQLFFFIAPPDNFALNCAVRILAWALLGGLAGVGLAAFIPNMRWPLGLAGGAAGGGAGCIGFIALSMVFGETLGRVAGGTVLGFCIGLMLTVAEVAFRSAWLEVRYGGRETITVNLGPEPVKIGGDARACTVWARGAAPVAVRFFIRDGRVICDDRIAETETEVSHGFSLDVGQITVTVRTSGAGAAVVVRQNRPRARPVPPLSLDEDDELPIPMHTPVQPPPAPPPFKPAIKPVSIDPAACPSCSRKCPGLPGARYCMVCDHTY